MKGEPRVVKTLNSLLADELTAINQYIVHAEMCDNWGYDRLHGLIEKRAIQEMKHAEMLIGRIIFLDGTPRVDKLNAIKIGPDVGKQLASDLDSEHEAVRAYNEAIKLADQAKDAVTRVMLEQIAHDEDEHVDWLEEQLDEIKQMGLELYLSVQVKKE